MPATSPGAATISVRGNQLVEAGHPLRLLGVNRSGAEYACLDGSSVFDGPDDDASVRAMASWRINAVRLPLNEDCWLGINGVPAATGGKRYQQAIKTYVNLLHSYGLAVILDLHWAAPGTTRATKLLPMPDMDHSPTFWTQVARTYRTDGRVIFDLYNEPFPDNQQDTEAGWTCVRDGQAACHGLLLDQERHAWSYEAAGMQTLLDAVRGAGATNLVLSGGVGFSETLDGWLAHRPRDPAHNLAASWHSYSFTGCVTSPCWDAQIAPAAAKVPVVAGEIGEDDCQHGYIDQLMGWLDTHGLSYLAWAWNVSSCTGGPDLISSYDGTPTAYGAGFRDHLANARPQAPAVSPTPTPTPTATPATPIATPATPVGATWQYQLQGVVDTTVPAAVFDIDGFDTPASTVAALHRQGRLVLCYIDAGAWEDWRSDAAQYPPAILGAEYKGYPDERWVDIRDTGALRAILRNRLQQQCVAKGFDAVEWDNVEGFAEPTGFPLTAADQLSFDRWLATITHEAGLRVALKNDRQQVSALQPSFDYAVDEECRQNSDCAPLQAFIAAGKPAFEVEYDPGSFSCAATDHLSLILKDTDLHARPWTSC